MRVGIPPSFPVLVTLAGRTRRALSLRGRILGNASLVWHLVQGIDALERGKELLLDDRDIPAITRSRRITILIDMEGSRVSQVNGLSVMSMGVYSFGTLARITAQTALGADGVMNIEGLSGESCLRDNCTGRDI